MEYEELDHEQEQEYEYTALISFILGQSMCGRFCASMCAHVRRHVRACAAPVRAVWVGSPTVHVVPGHVQGHVRCVLVYP